MAYKIQFMEAVITLVVMFATSCCAGLIPETLGALTELTLLQLHGNQLTGNAFVFVRQSRACVCPA